MDELSCFVVVAVWMVMTVSATTPTTTINNNNNNTTLNSSQQSNNTHYLMDVVYWEQKPFLFFNKKGEIDGIIPQMFEQANEFCLSKDGNVRINDFKRQMKNRKEFFDLVRSDVPYGTAELEGIRKQNAFWVPVVAYADRKIDHFKTVRNLRAFQLMKSDKIAVIVRRDMISLPNKIIRGIFSCQQIFFLAMLTAVLFGLVVWMIERTNNDDFPESFIRGIGIGLYWSIVSMTTVGYGDITPKNPFGRFIASIWLFLGVMVGCIVVATMTDVVTGVEDLNVLNKKVSVLEFSYEAKTAEKDYSAQVVPAKSYEEVLDFVRQGKVFAGMMNADVVAWYQDEINDDSASVPLRIVQKLPANLYVNCFVPADLAVEMKEIFKCMYFSKDEVYTYSIEAFQQYCHTDTLYIGSMSDLIFHNIYIQILLGAVCGLMLIGIGYDLINYWLLRKKGGVPVGKAEKRKLMEENGNVEKIDLNGYRF